jgi:hypothetical protein
MTSPNHTTLLHDLIRMVQCLLALLLLSIPAPVLAHESQILEHQVKTAFLYNFSRFVTWPEATLLDQPEFNLCVIGSDPFDTHLDKLTGKVVQDRTLVVRRLSSLAMVDDCQLLYIGEDVDLPEVLLLLREQPVLTVSDAAGFIEAGGIIQFMLIENRIRFRINVGAANTAGLSISSKLLSLAVSVSGEN